MNRDVVLELIRTHQPVSRAELSRLSGLQRSTVSLITEQLIGEHWVREGDVARLPRGRRPTLLGLNAELALLVADVHPGQASLAVVDLLGNFLTRRQLQLEMDPDTAIKQIGEALCAMREAHPKMTFEGVGISLPGRVDSDAQKLIFAPNLKWAGHPIREVIEKMTGLPTEMENGANAALLAELWLGHLDGVRDAVLVSISEGVGTGVLANGQLVTGRRGMAGEFGHVSLDREGPQCACGLQGCWEMYASTEAALRYYREEAGAQNGAATVKFADLLRMADDGDAYAVHAIARQAREIGRGLRTVCAGLSPEVIVVTGDMTGAWERYKPYLEEELTARTLGEAELPKLLVTGDCETTRLHGAAAIVLQRNSRFRGHRS